MPPRWGWAASARISRGGKIEKSLPQHRESKERNIRGGWDRNKALALLGLGWPAAEVLRHLHPAPNKATLSRWINRWLVEGWLIQDENATKVHGRLKIYRASETLAKKQAKNRNRNIGSGGGATYPPPYVAPKTEKTTLPLTVQNPSDLPFEVLASGVYHRPHKGEVVIRLSERPKADPFGWEKRIISTHQTPSGESRGVMLDLGGGWKAHYNEGPTRQALTIIPPYTELVRGDYLEDYLSARDIELWRCWRALRFQLRLSGELPEELTPKHIGCPLGDPDFIQEPAQTIETPEGPLWKDRSPHGVVPGTHELEGGPKVMLGLAAIPSRLDNIENQLNRLVGGPAPEVAPPDWRLYG